MKGRLWIWVAVVLCTTVSASCTRARMKGAGLAKTVPTPAQTPDPEPSTTPTPGAAVPGFSIVSGGTVRATGGGLELRSSIRRVAQPGPMTGGGITLVPGAPSSN